MEVSPNRGPIIGTPKRVPLILGNPHMERYVEFRVVADKT